MSETLILVILPIAFVGMWLAITGLLGALSGWYSLMARYPDHQDEALASYGWASGIMGAGVNFNNILRLGVCQRGLRVGLPHLFGIFCRPFFVPWSELQVTRTRGVFLTWATLEFGRPAAGRLRLRAGFADQLAAAAGVRWPR
jgi:hypothetical protein